VDDEADLRKSVRMVLTKAGYDVVEAQDGEEAVRTIRSGDNPLKVDAILCDLVMPKMSGQEAIVFFRNQFKGVPVVVMTGHPNFEGASDLFKKGVVDYLVKPVVPDKLLAVVQKAVNSHELFKDQFAT
jgi:two-component system chemotaxis response regulator CheY